MTWKKEGLIFTPTQQFSWMMSHAQVPTGILLNSNLIVFFSTRNAKGQSQIAKVILNAKNPREVISVDENPILKPGKPGTFDEDGVMPSSVVQVKNEIWLYYTGWNKKVSTAYHNAIGLAVSGDGGKTFHRLSDGPLLDRTREEPYLAITPCVRLEADLFKMWYASGIAWVNVQNKYEPVYVIKYASSKDGLTWQRQGQACILQKHEQEALCAPTVIKDNGCYKMWFSFRESNQFRDLQGSYRIGYAISSDGIHWERKDHEAGIQISENGWDSNMICYPSVIQHHHHWYMLYNGNDFGQSGFGYAIKQISHTANGEI